MNKLTLIIITLLLYIFVAILSAVLLPERIVYTFLAIVSFTGIFLFVYYATKHISDKIDKKTEFLNTEIFAQYSQIESLFAIYNLLKIDGILPPFRGWAISPDFASIILKKIRNNKAEQILECGSGVSTIIIGYLLKQRGSGHLYTLEHDAEYAKKTQTQLEKNNLSEYVTILQSELISHSIHNNTWQWYDYSGIGNGQLFDMLIIDGPPFQLQPKSRYPALPLLDKNLNNKAIILIDDCKREEDSEVVKQWLNEYSHYTEEWIDTEKGAYLLTKIKT
ncbi:MAG: class I SAM-dependent methyltransferase [Bacteroidales bacterium]|nr:class I SAM-dependent methyltransferase [Bacteroidales bacterium]